MRLGPRGLPRWRNGRPSVLRRNSMGGRGHRTCMSRRGLFAISKLLMKLVRFTSAPSDGVLASCSGEERRMKLFIAAACLATLAGLTQATAQPYPSRPITMVCRSRLAARMIRRRASWSTA